MLSKKRSLFLEGMLFSAVVLLAGCADSNTTPLTTEFEPAALFSEPAKYLPACGDCGFLCRLDAFDRASDKPDSLVSCALLRNQLGMVVLRSHTTPQLWLVTPEVLIRADYPIFDVNGLDLRPDVIQDTRRRWPWLWDRVDQPQATAASAAPFVGGALPSAPQAAAFAPEPLTDTPPTRWMAMATPEARVGTLAGIEGDFKDFAQKDFAVITEWIESAWPGPDGWRRMAWIDPQCPHCKDLIASGALEHFAPRIIMDPRAAEAQAASGWLLADPPDMERFLAFEPADEALSATAFQSQALLDELLYGLRPDWGFIVPVQMMRGDGWLLWWPGKADPPEPFASLLNAPASQAGAQGAIASQ